MSDETITADALVIFGISGDLAKKMTFTSLYLLDRRGRLDVPVIGVAFDQWSDDDLREHAATAIKEGPADFDQAAFDRFAKRLTYVQGDFTAASTYERVAAALGDAHAPVFYLEVPPSLFATVVGGLSDAGLTADARILVEKPFGHDLTSARELNRELHALIREDQLFRIDHFLGKLSVDDIVYLRFANSILEPVWNRHYIDNVQITMAENLDVADRGRFYDPVGALRDVVQNHLLQVLSLIALEPPTGGGGADVLSDRKRDVFEAMPDANPQWYVRGQYRGYTEVDGVTPDSQTETFCALRLEIDNWRWSGVPFFIRAGKEMPDKVTEIRIVFNHPPRLGFAPKHARRPGPNLLILRIDPRSGARLVMQAKSVDGGHHLRDIHLDMDFADEGGEGPTPYEELLHAAMIGDRTHFARQDAVEETWRIVQPLLDAAPPVELYEPGSWGPPGADKLIHEFYGWHEPWCP